MNAAFFILFLSSFMYGIFTGKGEALVQSILQSGEEAVPFCLTLVGVYVLWGGLLQWMEGAGMLSFLEKGLVPVLRFLSREKAGGEAEKQMARNFAANVLGLGNAATVSGIQACNLLKKEREGKAEKLLGFFLLMNTSSLQIFPTSLLSMRASLGSIHPNAILLPCLLSTLVSTLSAYFFYLFCETVLFRRRGY